MSTVDESWEPDRDAVDSLNVLLDSPVYNRDVYSPASPSKPVYTETPEPAPVSAREQEQEREPFSVGIKLSDTGSSLRDIWATYNQRYVSISDMLAHATQDENVGIVLFSTRTSLPDDVWRVKEYLRSFDHGRTSVSAIRARFPCLTDLQWTTLREQSEFVLDRRSHTMGLTNMQRTYVPPDRTRRKTRRRDEHTERTRIQQALHHRSGPVGKSELAKETNLPRSTVSACLEALMTGRNPAVYEFVDGPDRTYGLVKNT